jgi:hypothetical protein
MEGAGAAAQQGDRNVTAKSTMSRALMTVLMVCGGASAVRAQSLEMSEPIAMVAWSAPEPSIPAAAWSAPKPLAQTAWSAPALRLSLTSAFVGLQALDVATTLHGVRSGSAVEANPLISGLTKSPAAFVAVKGALTAATVASVNSLARKHPKAAVLTMLALNAGSAFVVQSNFRVAITR